MINVYINSNIVKKNVYQWVGEILSTYSNDYMYFQKNQYGKPYLKDFTYFNLSHCNSICVLAVSGCDVGVDIEQLRSNGLIDTTSKYYSLYPNTKEKLTKWVCLEAYNKCMGYGFTKGINLDFELKAVDTKIVNNLDYKIRVYTWSHVFIYVIQWRNNYQIAIAQSKLINSINFNII